jgi:hypothetical protein
MWNMTVMANCHLDRVSMLNDVSYFRAKGTGGTRGFSPVPPLSGCDEQRGPDLSHWQSRVSSGSRSRLAERRLL